MEPRVHSTTSIFPVEDISATIAYYRDVLGASDSWEWGKPPSHAGCKLGSVWIQFSLNPELCRAARGLSLFLNVLEIDNLHQLHQDNGANIIDPFGPRPWGVLEYVVEDCNGVHLRFAQGGFTSDRKPKLEGVSIVGRQLTIQECRTLLVGVNWMFKDTQDSLQKTVTDPVFTAIAEFKGQCIGAASILGHQSGHYLIYNVMVLPDYQSQGVGKQLMSALNDWLAENGIPGAMVKLFTGLDRQAFYQQFGFTGSESGLVGMSKTLPNDA